VACVGADILPASAPQPAQRGIRRPAREQARPGIKGGLDGRAIASMVERSSGAGNLRDPDVAGALVRFDAVEMTKAVVDGSGRSNGKRLLKEVHKVHRP
jgi:hypothetical protein